MPILFKVKDKNQSEHKFGAFCNFAKVLLSRILTPALFKGLQSTVTLFFTCSVNAPMAGLAYSFTVCGVRVDGSHHGEDRWERRWRAFLSVFPGCAVCAV